MLVNLLIAMFNERYEDISKQSEENWKFNIASTLMQNLRLQHPAPTPLNLFMIPWWVYRGIETLRAALKACLKVEEQKRREEELKELKELFMEQAIDIVRLLWTQTETPLTYRGTANTLAFNQNLFTTSAASMCLFTRKILTFIVPTKWFVERALSHFRSC